MSSSVETLVLPVPYGAKKIFWRRSAALRRSAQSACQTAVVSRPHSSHPRAGAAQRTRPERAARNESRHFTNRTATHLFLYTISYLPRIRVELSLRPRIEAGLPRTRSLQRLLRSWQLTSLAVQSHGKATIAWRLPSAQ